MTILVGADKKALPLQAIKKKPPSMLKPTPEEEEEAAKEAAAKAKGKQPIIE